MKPSFLRSEKPLVTAMIRCSTPDECINKIGRSLNAGAEAIGVQLEWLKGEYLTKGNLKNIFSACDGLPVYATANRWGIELRSDEDLCELLVTASTSGATMVDVPGDAYFENLKYGMNIAFTDVARQLLLIRKMRYRGCEILMSSAVRGRLSVYEYEMIASDQETRGADIISIVSSGLSREDLPEYQMSAQRVREMTDKPLQLEISGEGIALADMPQSVLRMYRCVESRGEHDLPTMPLISEVTALLNK